MCVCVGGGGGLACRGVGAVAGVLAYMWSQAITGPG